MGTEAHVFEDAEEDHNGQQAREVEDAAAGDRNSQPRQPLVDHSFPLGQGIHSRPRVVEHHRYAKASLEAHSGHWVHQVTPLAHPAAGTILTGLAFGAGSASALALASASGSASAMASASAAATASASPLTHW
ncbi:hypothetical protein TCAL_15955 [Tigriopus californicus]|uniref:Uncharacterized protein n=1 Tax=Tigriopus californicus TaxID=6832 RepID=A0A553PII4_TIGCA|nr:hypothetical protein TCAL_15955 [Tigriopus californicus]